jgi:glycosyl transferase, family 25
MLIPLIASALRAISGSPDTRVEITYISLDHRTDRQALLEAELDHFGVSYTRTSAIKANTSFLNVVIRHSRRRRQQLGALGCALSHVKALQDAKGNVLVLEDDVTFRYMPNLRRLLREDWWDVIALAYNGGWDPRECRTVHGAGYCKSTYFRTSAAYLVRGTYKPTLVKNLNTSWKRLANGTIPRQAALDQSWHDLQVKDRWYVGVPRIAHQRPSYSDIENKNVDYGV